GRGCFGYVRGLLWIARQVVFANHVSLRCPGKRSNHLPAEPTVCRSADLCSKFLINVCVCQLRSDCRFECAVFGSERECYLDRVKATVSTDIERLQRCPIGHGWISVDSWEKALWITRRDRRSSTPESG